MGAVISKGRLYLAVAVGGVAALLSAAPSLVDWSPLKVRIAAGLEQALHRPVVIEGPLSVSLLPTPRVSAQGVRLANPPGAANPDMARLAGLEARLKLLPLLTGRLDVSSLVLKSPDIDLERLPDGSGNWTLTPAASPATPANSTPAPATSSSPAPSDTKASDTKAGDPMVFDDIRIESGRLVYRGDKDGKGLVIDDIDADLSIDGPQGPVSAKGSARIGAVPLALDAHIAQWGQQGRDAPAALLVSLGEGGLDLRLSGQVAGQGNDATFKGKISLKSTNLSRLAATLGASGDWPVAGFSLDSSVTADRRSLRAEDIQAALGQSQGSGRLSVSLEPRPQIDGKLSFTRIDLDALLAKTVPIKPLAAPDAPATQAAPSQPNPPALTPTAQGKIATQAPPLPTPPSGFALPKGIGAVLDISSEAVIWHNGLLRGAHLNAELADGDLVLNQASISLPGDSDLNLFGYVGAQDGHPVFDGSFEASTDNLRGLFDWLAIKTDKVPADRLRAARLGGKIAVEPAHLRLDGVQVKMDGTRIDAAADLRLSPKPALGVTFAIDTLNLDAYLPKSAPAGTDKPAAQTVAAAAPAPTPAMTTPQQPAPVPFWLDGVDANIKGGIGKMVVHGQTANDVKADVGWIDGALTLRDVSVRDLAGSQLKISGGLSDLQAGPRFKALRATLQSPALGRLTALAGVSLPFDPDRLGNVVLSGSFDGLPNALSIDIGGEASGLTLRTSGKLDGGPAQPRFDLAIEASHTSATQVLHLLGSDYRPVGPLGAFALSTRLKGEPGSALHFSDLRLKAGPLTATGDVKLALSGKPRLDATLSANDFAIDPFLPSKRQADARPHLRDMIAQGLLIPTRGVASRPIILARGPEPTAPTAAPRPSVAVGDIPQKWSDASLGLHSLNSLDADLKLTALAVTWGRTRFDQPSTELVLNNGALNIDQLNAQLWGGKLTGAGQLAADGTAAAKLALSHAQAREAVLGLADLDIAQGVMDIDAALTTKGLTSADMAARLAGTGKISVTDGVLKGFDLKAVDQRLQAVDGPLALLGLLQAGLSGGSTRFSSLNGTFHADKGVITTNDLTLTADGGGAKAEGSANLPNNAIDARAEFHLAGATQAPPLVLRLTGALDHPRRFIDINGIQGWLAQRGLDKPMKGKAADAARSVLQQLLGGKKGADAAPTPAAPTQTEAPPEKVKPKDVLKGLIKGLH